MEKRDKREMESKREGEMERSSEVKMEKVDNEKDRRIWCVDRVNELEEKEMREVKGGRNIRIVESLYNILHFAVSIRGACVCAYLSPASAKANRVASAEYSSTLSRSIKKFPFDLAFKYH